MDKWSQLMKELLDSSSNDNALFVTGLCDNKCLMCCQPPTQKNDLDFFFKKNVQLIKNAPKNLPVLGITGGEPTMLGDKLFELFSLIRIEMPETYIHLLSNGRKFSDEKYVKKLKEVSGENLLVGIPLHSDFINTHDEITQSKGSYTETILGLYNLASYSISIELRIVVNKKNYYRLPEMANFIFKNLPFVEFVSFISMEYLGNAVKCTNTIWIEPIDYISELEEAVLDLSTWGLNVSIMNIPLCLLTPNLYRYSMKSISDWKNTYSTVCENCLRKNECCGLFSTSKMSYKGIKPFEL